MEHPPAPSLPDASPQRSWLHELAPYLLGLYLLVLLWLTYLPLPPLPWDGPQTGGVDLNLRLWRTINRALELGPGSAQFRLLVGNVLAFVPLGLLLPLLRPGRHLWPLVLLAGLALTVVIELGQLGLTVLIGSAYRSADIDDVILNMLGVAIGYGAYRGLRLATTAG